jgi:hypothetical protein
MHSGEVLTRFFDRDGQEGLKWGVEWRSKISSTIFGTTFFIPVISPSYLKSPNCRDEFMQFWKLANSSDLNELLLPILWVPVHPATPAEEEVWDIVQSIQYLDFTKARLENEDSPEFEGLVDQMGERLSDVARQVGSKPEVVPVDKDDTGLGGGGGGGGDGGGVIDAWVEAEELAKAVGIQLAEAQRTLKKAMDVLQTTKPPAPNASSGQKLTYLNRVSLQMLPSAEEFEAAAEQAETKTREMSDQVFIVFEFLKDPALAAQLQQTDLTQLRQLPDVLSSRFGNYDQARTQIAQLGRLSRSMTKPVSAMQRGFDSLDAIRALLASWAAALETSPNATD